MSKSKSVNEYSDIKIKYLNNKTKGHCLMICQTGVLFLGHPIEVVICLPTEFGAKKITWELELWRLLIIPLN